MEAEAQRRRRMVADPSVQLSSEELAEVLQEASRRQGKSVGDNAASFTKVDEVFAMAEELGIPEEHVRAALASRQRTEQTGKRGLMGSFLVAGIAGGVTGLGLFALGLPTLLTVIGAFGVAVAALVIALIAAAMKKYPANPTGPAPVPGTCRVCFRPAHTPQSTFCDEHRYKMPGAAG